jgi:hypothetical protein
MGGGEGKSAFKHRSDVIVEERHPRRGQGQRVPYDFSSFIVIHPYLMRQVIFDVKHYNIMIPKFGSRAVAFTGVVNRVDLGSFSRRRLA